MNFQTSTHKAHWLLSPEMLASKREEAQQRAAASLKRSREPTPEDGMVDASKRPKVEAPVTLEEEQLLRAYYEVKVKAICEQLRQPTKVESTALQYVKRFYTRHSCLEYDPARIVTTAMYLACKVEESYISADSFQEKVGVDVKALLKTEVPLLQGLGFDLVVYSPYRALHGLFQELDQLRTQRSPLLDVAICDATPDQLVAAHAAARSAVGTLLLSDAPLLFPPGLLAVAALRSGLRSVRLPYPQLLAHVASKAVDLSGGSGQQLLQGVSDPGEALRSVLDQVDELVVKQQWSKMPDLEARATDIDLRIKLWKGPSNAGRGSKQQQG